jgi:hypothetical protein
LQGQHQRGQGLGLGGAAGAGAQVRALGRAKGLAFSGGLQA